MNVFGTAEEEGNKGEALGIKGTSVMVVQGYREELFMRSLANGSASCDRMAISNLGYKKDAFLEPSLVATTTHPPNKPLPPFPTYQTSNYYHVLQQRPTIVRSLRWCSWL